MRTREFRKEGDDDATLAGVSLINEIALSADEIGGCLAFADDGGLISADEHLRGQWP